VLDVAIGQSIDVVVVEEAVLTITPWESLSVTGKSLMAYECNAYTDLAADAKVIVCVELGVGVAGSCHRREGHDGDGGEGNEEGNLLPGLAGL